MKTKINNTTYTIKEVHDIHDYVEVDEQVWGATVFSVGLIFIEKHLIASVKRSTLIHELTHAFLMEHGMNHEHKSIEEVCDFMGAHADRIVGIADKYFERLNKGGKHV